MPSQGENISDDQVLECWKDVPAALDSSLKRLESNISILKDDISCHDDYDGWHSHVYLLHSSCKVGSDESTQEVWKGLETVKAQGKV